LFGSSESIPNSGIGEVLAFAVSMMRSTLPSGCTVRPTESSAPRNSRYASSGVISSGATMVTFLLLDGMVPGSKNCLQVMDEIHEMRSPSSVSGFRFNFTIRLPAGNFLQELNSFSPTTVPPVTSVVAPAAPAVAGAVVGAMPGCRRFARRSAGEAGGGVPAGCTRTGCWFTPSTTAPCAAAASVTTAAIAAAFQVLVLVFIGWCSPW
jgi:hypothetical protein